METGVSLGVRAGKWDGSGGGERADGGPFAQADNGDETGVVDPLSIADNDDDEAALAGFVLMMAVRGRERA